MIQKSVAKRGKNGDSEGEMKKKAAVSQSGMNTDPSKKVREATPASRGDVGSNPTSGTSLKRVTKRELDHRLTLALAELADTRNQLAWVEGQKKETAQKLARFEQVAGVRFDQLSGGQHTEVRMTVDMNSYHRYGKAVLIEAVRQCFIRLAEGQEATLIPDIQELAKDCDLMRFFEEWLSVACRNSPYVLNLQEKNTARAIVTRLFDVIVRIQKAGLDNHKARDRIMWDAYQNPIK